jgi:hypothetical protein
MSGARNMHAIAGYLDKARREVFDRACIFRPVHKCTGPTVGFIETWDLRQNPLCQAHADQGARMGYHIWTREELGIAPREDRTQDQPDTG